MKNLSRRTCLGLVACLLFTAFLAGQTTQTDESFVIGGAHLHIGMAEADARRQLTPDSITPGGIVISESLGPLGSVSFKNGRLAWATKDWDRGLDQAASVEVIRRLVSLVSGKPGCKAATTELNEPTLRSSTLVIQCSVNRQVEVSVSETPGSGKTFVNVRESFGRP